MKIFDLPSIRVNQTGYAAGLPIHAAVITDADVCLWDAKGNKIKNWASCPSSVDAASGERVALLDLGPLPAGSYVLENSGEKTRR